MKRFIIEKSADGFYTSHSGLVLISLCLNRFTSLRKHLGTLLRLKENAFSHAAVVRRHLSPLRFDKSDFAAIKGFRQSRFFRETLGYLECRPKQRCGNA
jgi:hypothetical protein